MEKRILVSWIGFTDLWAMGQASGDQKLMERIEEVIGKKPPADPVGDGPVRTLVSQRRFDESHFLSQWPDDLNSRFESWLGVKATFRNVGKDRLWNPTSYEQVTNVSKSELKAIREESPNCRFSILLSPGTPTMHTVWLLLGTTLFPGHPATFFQTFNGTVTEERIPFDITLDVIPEYLRKPDTQLQQLAFAGPGEVKGFEQIKGKSTELMLAVRRAERAAIRDVAVLLTGESGTGKELFSRAMHRASHRGRNDPEFKNFQARNCAAIPRELLESELFGHEKGAFSGAHKEHIGAFEQADGGTLFLDEVGELSLEHQAKLLRALEPVRGEGPCARLVRRVGGKEEIRCDVRIIAATNQNLLDGIRDHRFRADLFYRLGVIQIRLPALRDRRSDLEILASEILGRVNGDLKIPDAAYEDKKLAADALRRMRKHNWPGNIRELQNVLTQAAVFALSPEITAADIDSAIASYEYSTNESVFSRMRGDTFRLPDRLAEIERVLIEDAMSESDGTQKDAAELLGISQQALSKKLKTQSKIDD